MPKDKCETTDDDPTSQIPERLANPTSVPQTVRSRMTQLDRSGVQRLWHGSR